MAELQGLLTQALEGDGIAGAEARATLVVQSTKLLRQPTGVSDEKVMQLVTPLLAFMDDTSKNVRQEAALLGLALVQRSAKLCDRVLSAVNRTLAKETDSGVLSAVLFTCAGPRRLVDIAFHHATTTANRELWRAIQRFVHILRDILKGKNANQPSPTVCMYCVSTLETVLVLWTAGRPKPGAMLSNECSLELIIDSDRMQARLQGVHALSSLPLSACPPFLDLEELKREGNNILDDMQNASIQNTSGLYVIYLCQVVERLTRLSALRVPGIRALLSISRTQPSAKMEGVQISSIHNAIRISLICVMKRGNWEHESEGVLEALGKHCGRERAEEIYNRYRSVRDIRSNDKRKRDLATSESRGLKRVRRDETPSIVRATQPPASSTPSTSRSNEDDSMAQLIDIIMRAVATLPSEPPPADSLPAATDKCTHLLPQLTELQQKLSTISPLTEASAAAAARDPRLARKIREQERLAKEKADREAALIKGAQAKAAAPVKEKRRNPLKEGFTSDMCIKLAEDAVRRIAAAEQGAERQGRLQLHAMLLSRHLTITEWERPIIQDVIAYLTEDMSLLPRVKIAQLWLDHEYGAAKTGVYKDLNRYICLLLQLLDPVLDRIYPQEKQTNQGDEYDPMVMEEEDDPELVRQRSLDALSAASSLLLDAPYLPEAMADRISDLSQDEDATPERKEAGLIMLTKMAKQRPKSSKQCIEALLQFAVKADPHVREVAVKMISSELYVESTLRPIIEEFALRCTEDVCTTTVVEKEEDKKEPAQLTADEAHHKLELFYAVCRKHNDLLKRFIELFSSGDDTVKRAILTWSETTHLFRQIRQTSPVLSAILSNLPSGGDTLLLHLLHSMLDEKGKPIRSIVFGVRDLVKSSGNGRLLIPILYGLAKEDVVEYLPMLISLDRKASETSLQRILAAKLLSPQELLIHLHNLTPERHGAPLRKILEATSICMQDKRYTNQVLASAIQQLADSSPVPSLTMRTAMVSYKKFPAMKQFLIGILKRLITKRAWENETLWRGFLKCIRSLLPKSATLLLELPLQNFNDALESEPALRPALLEYLEAHPDESIPRGIQDVVWEMVKERREKREAEEAERLRKEQLEVEAERLQKEQEGIENGSQEDAKACGAENSDLMDTFSHQLHTSESANHSGEASLSQQSDAMTDS